MLTKTSNRRTVLAVCLIVIAGCTGFSVEMSAMKNKQSDESAIPEIVAHRGFSYAAPENTKAAIELAWQIGCPAAGCDVYLTKDLRVMLMHDESAKRTTGADLNMTQTPSVKLCTLDAGSWKDPRYAGEKIPFLEEVLETIPDRGTLLIETKSGPEILPYLKELIDKSGKADRLSIICFDLDTIAAAKRMMPSIPAYLLVDTQKDKLTGKPIPHSVELIRTAKDNGLDGLDVHYAGITEKFAEAVQKSGLKLCTWTVDDAQEARRLERLGVCSITTNRPDYIMETLHYPKNEQANP